jgi:hypothetical protein
LHIDGESEPEIDDGEFGHGRNWLIEPVPNPTTAETILVTDMETGDTFQHLQATQVAITMRGELTAPSR